MRPILKVSTRKRSPNKSSNVSTSPHKKSVTNAELTSPSGRRVTFSPFAKPRRQKQLKRLQSDRIKNGVVTSGFAFSAADDREVKRAARRKRHLRTLQTLHDAACKPRLSWLSLVENHLAFLKPARVRISHWLSLMKAPFLAEARRRQNRRVLRSRTRHAPRVYFDWSDRQYVQCVRAPLLAQTVAVAPDYTLQVFAASGFDHPAIAPQPALPVVEPILTPFHSGSLSTLLRKVGIPAIEDETKEQAAVRNDLRGVTHGATGLKIVPHHQGLRVVPKIASRVGVSDHRNIVRDLPCARSSALLITSAHRLEVYAARASSRLGGRTRFHAHLLVPQSMGTMISTLVFQPPPPSYGPTRRYFFLGTAMHNRIPAFYLAYDNAEYTILFSHGNAEDLGMIYDWFREVARRLQVNVMAYDYSGYGLSEGEPSEEAVYSDAEAAFAYLVNVKKTPPSRIILYGRSLGSGPSTYIAVKQSRLNDPVAGVILQSPLMSIFRVAFNFRFTIPGDLFCNIDIMDEVESPVTIIHGTRDEVVPFWHGEGLFERCRQEWRCKPLWVTDAGHNNIEAFLSAQGDEFFTHLIDFVNVCRDTTAVRLAQNGHAQPTALK